MRGSEFELHCTLLDVVFCRGQHRMDHRQGQEGQLEYAANKFLLLGLLRPETNYRLQNPVCARVLRVIAAMAFPTKNTCR